MPFSSGSACIAQIQSPSLSGGLRVRWGLVDLTGLGSWDIECSHWEPTESCLPNVSVMLPIPLIRSCE